MQSLLERNKNKKTQSEDKANHYRTLATNSQFRIGTELKLPAALSIPSPILPPGKAKTIVEDLETNELDPSQRSLMISNIPFVAPTPRIKLGTRKRNRNNS